MLANLWILDRGVYTNTSRWGFRSCAVLFSDAKVLEDVDEHILSRDLSRDGAESINGFADVLAD